MGSQNLVDSIETEINEASLRSIPARELENNFSARKKEALQTNKKKFRIPNEALTSR